MRVDTLGRRGIVFDVSEFRGKLCSISTEHSGIQRTVAAATATYHAAIGRRDRRDRRQSLHERRVEQASNTGIFFLGNYGTARRSSVVPIESKSWFFPG